MAKLPKNSLLHGVSGTFIKITFRQRNGKIIISQKPVFNSKKATVAQKKTRSKFAEASLFAKRATQDPLKKEYYKKLAKEMNLSNAYIAAVKEFLIKASQSSEATGERER
jgi:hypothetical protein